MPFAFEPSNARRAPPHPRPPRPLRPDSRARRSRLPRTDPRHPRDGRPRRDRAARLGEAPGRVRRALERASAYRGGARRPGRRREQSEAAARGRPRTFLPSACAAGPPEGSTETRAAALRRRATWSRRSASSSAAATTATRSAVTDGVTAVFHDAGHILGSAIIELRVHRRREQTHDRLLRRPRAASGTPILRDPTPLTACRVRGRGVDVRQPRARSARRGDRGARRRPSARWPATRASCSSRRSPSVAPRSSSGCSTISCVTDASRACRSTSTRRWRRSATTVYHDHPEVYDEETGGAAALRRLAAQVPGPAVHRLGRGVEGDPPRQPRPIMVVAASGNAHRRPDHAPPQGLPPRSEDARSSSSATRARARSAGTSRTGEGRAGSTARRSRCAAAYAPSPASARMPTSTSWRRGSRTSGAPATAATGGRRGLHRPRRPGRGRGLRRPHQV